VMDLISTYNQVTRQNLFDPLNKLNDTNQTKLIRLFAKSQLLWPFVTIQVNGDKMFVFHYSESQGVYSITVLQQIMPIINEYTEQRKSKKSFYDHVLLNPSIGSVSKFNVKNFGHVEQIYYLIALFVLYKHRTGRVTVPPMWTGLVHKTTIIGGNHLKPLNRVVDLSQLYILPKSSEVKEFLTRQFKLYSSKSNPPLMTINTHCFSYLHATRKFSQVSVQVVNGAPKFQSMTGELLEPRFMFRHQVTGTPDDLFQKVSNLYWNICLYYHQFEKLPEIYSISGNREAIQQLIDSQERTTELVEEHSPETTLWMVNGKEVMHTKVLYKAQNSDDLETKLIEIVRKFEHNFPDLTSTDYIGVMEDDIVYRITV